MRKRLTELGGTLLVFSLIVTAFLIASFMLYIRFIPTPKLNLPNYLADINFDAYSFALAQGTDTIPIDSINGFIPRENIGNLYLTAIIADLPYLLVFILFFFTVSAIILSKILENQREKQAHIFAKQLSQINDSGELFLAHPAVIRAYMEVKSRMETNAQDYIRLSSYVTHEQKNMLSLLRAKLQLSENTELMADVDKVVDNLDDILTLSASVKNTDLKIIDAALVCAEVCDEYKKVYSNIVFDFDDSANTQVASKDLWINRALSNLINNAIKYTKGKIEVIVSNQNGSVIIKVSDKGNGINDDELDKLFDYQYRIGKLKKDGYGIGLSLVRHVCDICGGLCYAESKQEEGTIFYMVFPEV